MYYVKSNKLELCESCSQSSTSHLHCLAVSKALSNPLQSNSLAQGNPKHRLCREWTVSSPGEKDKGVLVDEKLKMTQQWVLTAQNAK